MHRTNVVPGLDTPSYSLNDVAAAVGITTAEVKRMLTDGGQKATGAPGRFTLRRVLSIALTAKARSFGMNSRVTGVIARDFADGGPRDRPWLESPQPSFIILYCETGNYRFVAAANPTFHEALKDPGGGLAASFAVINCAGMVQRVKERLAQCEAARQP
jgi:hypothetical protein